MALVARRFPFSDKVNFVLAGLDRSVAVDENALATLDRHGLVVPVIRNARLRNKLIRHGFTPEHLQDMYLIPFRQPRERTGTNLITHRRSIHTTTDIEGKRFVFKGSGLANWPVSYASSSTDRSQAREFAGGAATASTKRLVETLSTLDRHFENSKQSNDGLVKWAAEQHGITELPVMRHVATFRPLEILATGQKAKELGGTRLPITPQLMERLGVGKFFNRERVHVYSAKEPNRIEEDVDLFKPAAVRDADQHSGVDVDSKILTRFLVRGLLLLHIGHKNRITFTNAAGSPLAPRNAGPLEFFDFGGMDWPPIDSEERREKDFHALCFSAKLLAEKLAGRRSSFYVPPAFTALVKSALETARGSLSYGEKSKKFKDKVKRMVRLLLRDRDER